MSGIAENISYSISKKTISKNPKKGHYEEKEIIEEDNITPEKRVRAKKFLLVPLRIVELRNYVLYFLQKLLKSSFKILLCQSSK